jgi:hypothetical protein
MPTKYVLLAISGDRKDAKPTRVLIIRITKLEKFQDNRLEVQKCGSQPVEQFFLESMKKHKEISIWRLCFMVSQGEKKTVG